MPDWQNATREDIEAHVGSPLPALPAHEVLYQQVVERGGGNYQKIYRDIFEAVDVRKLPPFHNPSQCTHFDRFRNMEDAAKGPDGRHWTFYDELRIGGAFIATLTQEDVAACFYHQADWRAIADESVGILTELGTQEIRAQSLE
jgi:hypothetical protein